MIFWDASAIVPLLLSEADTSRIRSVLEKQGGMVVWWGTVVECLSAVARSERDGGLPAREAQAARRRLGTLRDTWREILPAEEVRERAGTVLLRHPLRAADALQLGAALTWVRGRPRSHRFLTLDARLGSAARGEGFDLALPDRSPSSGTL